MPLSPWLSNVQGQAVPALAVRAVEHKDAGNAGSEQGDVLPALLPIAVLTLALVCLASLSFFSETAVAWST